MFLKIAIQPAVGYYNIWPNIRCSCCSPLVENHCETALLLVACRTEPLSQPMLTHHPICSFAFTREQVHTKCLWTYCVKLVRILDFQIITSSLRGHWVNRVTLLRVFFIITTIKQAKQKCIYILGTIPQTMVISFRQWHICIYIFLNEISRIFYEVISNIILFC